MVIYSFVGISGPLKTWLLIEGKKKKKKRKKKKKKGDRKIVLKAMYRPNKLEEMKCPWLSNTLWRTENTAAMEA